jgi:hypothetical protein
MATYVRRRLMSRSRSLGQGGWWRFLRNGQGRSPWLLQTSLIFLSGWGLGLIFNDPAIAQSPSDCLTQPRLFPPEQAAVITPHPFQQRTGFEGIAATTTQATRAKEAIPIAPADTTAAPSVLWLIVMPAIPLVGGGLIYFKRAWTVSQSATCPPPPGAPTALTDAGTPAAPDTGTGDQDTLTQKE